MAMGGYISLPLPHIFVSIASVLGGGSVPVVGTWFEAGEQAIRDFSGIKHPAERGALSGWVNDRYCEILGYVESGFRVAGLDWAANSQAWLRGFQRCDPQLSSDLTASTDPAYFQGGQCPVSYYVAIAWDYPGAGSFSPPGYPATSEGWEVPGPIRGLSFRPGGPLAILGTDGNGNPVSATVLNQNNPGFRSASIHSVKRVDRLPDNCGSLPAPPPTVPPGVGLPPPPAEGQEIFPREYRDVTLDGPDGPFPVTVEIGPAIYVGIGTISINVNGKPYRLNPDGDVVDGNDEPGTSDDPDGIADKLNDIADKLNELQNELLQPVEGELFLTDCAGNDNEAMYSGRAFKGLQSMIAAAYGLYVSGYPSQCPLPEQEMVGDARTIATIAESDGVEVEIIPIPSIARYVYIEIEGNPPGLRVHRLAGEQIEANFGFWSLGFVVGNEEYNGPPYQLVNRKMSLPLIERMGLGRYARISLKKGLSARLLIQEIASDGG